MLSKIERGERTAKRDHVDGLIEILKLDNQNAKTLWLADQLYAMISEEDEAISGRRTSKIQSYKKLK